MPGRAAGLASWESGKLAALKGVGAGATSQLPTSTPEWAEAGRSDTGHGGGHGARRSA